MIDLAVGSCDRPIRTVVCTFFSFFCRSLNVFSFCFILWLSSFLVNSTQLKLYILSSRCWSNVNRSSSFLSHFLFNYKNWSTETNKKENSKGDVLSISKFLFVRKLSKRSFAFSAQSFCCVRLSVNVTASDGLFLLPF